MSNAARYYELLKRPLMTEKAASLTENMQYTFEVAIDANKIDLAKAFELAFPGRKVTNVRTVRMYPQQKRVGNRMGHTSASKKAIFTITGEPLELFTGA